MTIEEFFRQWVPRNGNGNNPMAVEIDSGRTVMIYPHSVRDLGAATVFIGRFAGEKCLFLYSPERGSPPENVLAGDEIPMSFGGPTAVLRRCRLTRANAAAVQQLFPFTRPVVVGLKNSFGFGDRLGLANPGHIRSLGHSPFVPVLAQQSIRELTRTQRQPEDVMHAAVWAVMQEGYSAGFGADADHLKTPEDIDLMVKAGFTMFTFDPSAHVVNEADTISEGELALRSQKLNWEGLRDSLSSLVQRYEGVSVAVSRSFSVKPGRAQVLRALVKYGNALAHIRSLDEYLKTTYPDHLREVEVSVDETDAVTSPFEHYFIASELTRLGVEIVSLAPRFVGDFERGIDCKGSIDRFTEEYLKHVEIADHFGSYKISFHSGSDKFRVYEAVGKTRRGKIHVKTAGTSYLEALHVLASADPALFREILDFARTEFETEKKSYHVTAMVARVLPATQYSDTELPELFTSDDARQVLHVTFGKVLTTKDVNARYRFRDRILRSLTDHEDVYYEYLVRHFRRHLEPLTLD